MTFAIFLGVCIGSFVVAIILAVICEHWGPGGFLEALLAISSAIFVISLVVSVIWMFCGGFNYIKNPEYNYVLTEEVSIAEFDTKKKETGIHDIAYIDSEKYIVYIDSALIEKARVTVCDGDEAQLEIYHCIPKNNTVSVDLKFNRHYEYKVYVPDGYKVVSINLK